MTRFDQVAALIVIGVLAAEPVLAQSGPSAPPAATPSAPSPAPPPPATLVQPGVPGAPDATSQPSPSNAATLVPQAGDPGDVDEVVLPAKPVAILSGQSSWDDGLKTVRASLATLRDALEKAGVKVNGRPLAVFTDTTDDTFKFDAELPVDLPAGASPPSLPGGSAIRFGTTPSGKAFRFVHKGPYDEIDSTYETITTYLDAKDIVAKDAFVEEYLSDTADPADAKTEVNIFVQPQ